MNYKGSHWHEKCFLCSICKTPLADIPFGYKNDQTYCRPCYIEHCPIKCDACNKKIESGWLFIVFNNSTIIFSLILTGMKRLETHGKSFHEQCFKCFSCSEIIGTQSFIPKDETFYCVKCYSEKFAYKCVKCMEVSCSTLQVANIINLIIYLSKTLFSTAHR